MVAKELAIEKDQTEKNESCLRKDSSRTKKSMKNAVPKLWGGGNERTPNIRLPVDPRNLVCHPRNPDRPI